MDAQTAIIASKLRRTAELKEENSTLRARNVALQRRIEELESHLDMAIAAARDLESLSCGGSFVIADGWNLILGANGGETILGPRPHSPAELERDATSYLATHPSDFVWIVYDGPHEKTLAHDRLRISYTGGEGTQRADRFIADFVRAARWRTPDANIILLTNDKKLAASCRKISSDKQL